jgi:hypothetical protein
MIGRITTAVLLLAAGLGFSTSARAQAPAASAAERSFLDVYGAPGNYGTMYGSASYGVPLNHSRYSSSYGAGYAYGYPPATILPGPYGMGIWRPSQYAQSPGYRPGDGFYRTIPIPYTAHSTAPLPPIGAYAPDYGPGAPGGF